MFYRLYRDPAARRRGLRLAVIEKQPEIDVPWRAGQAVRVPLPLPIRCALGARSGPDIPDAFLSDRIPLFSERLVGLLRKVGVDNIQSYPAEVVDSCGKRVGHEFCAVNVVGLISCMDAAKSQYDPQSEFPMLRFEKLVIDEKATKGAKLFRLAENPSFILVSEAVKEEITAADLINVRALSLEDPAAY